MAERLDPAVIADLEAQNPGCDVKIGAHGQIDITPRGRSTEEQLGIVLAEMKARRQRVSSALLARAEALGVMVEVGEAEESVA